MNAINVLHANTATAVCYMLTPAAAAWYVCTKNQGPINMYEADGNMSMTSRVTSNQSACCVATASHLLNIYCYVWRVGSAARYMLTPLLLCAAC